MGDNKVDCSKIKYGDVIECVDGLYWVKAIGDGMLFAERCESSCGCYAQEPTRIDHEFIVEHYRKAERGDAQEGE